MLEKKRIEALLREANRRCSIFSPFSNCSVTLHFLHNALLYKLGATLTQLTLSPNYYNTMSSIQKLLDSYRTTKGKTSPKDTKKNDDVVMDLKHGVFAITDHFNAKPIRSPTGAPVDPIAAQLKIRYHIRRLKIARRQMLLTQRKSG